MSQSEINYVMPQGQVTQTPLIDLLCRWGVKVQVSIKGHVKGQLSIKGHLKIATSLNKVADC